MQEARQGSAVDDDLGLDVVTCHDVPHRSQGGADDRLLVVHEELDYPPADAAVDNCLDLVVGSVTEIGESPAGVSQDVSVVMEQEPGEDRQGWGDLKSLLNNNSSLIIVAIHVLLS